MKKTFAISTLGCKVNAFESESYIQSLNDRGYQEVDFKEKADIYIINTCCVTNTAASKSRQRINHAIHLNPEAFICVVGCYVQTFREDLEDNPQIDLLIGKQGKDKLAELIDQRATEIRVDEDILDFESLSLDGFSHKTRGFLKIQDGCNQRCSFCIIPDARGQERSMAFDEVMMMIKQMVKQSHQEIVLTGIHTGRYGRNTRYNLDDVLLRAQTIEGLRRIRVSSIEITEVSDSFIEMIHESTKIANHLHIPLQSGANDILKVMRRPYTVEQFVQRVKEIRNRCPHISISTDLIVGFPGETDELFEETMKTLRRLQFSFIHVFPYSSRKDTPASKMKDQVNGKIKKLRTKEVVNLSKEHEQNFLMSFVGSQRSILLESYQDGYWSGLTSEYCRVYIQGDYHINQWIDVLITHYSNGRLIGKAED